MNFSFDVYDTLLINEYKKLKKSEKHLEQSYIKCQSMVLKDKIEDYSDSELEQLEILTARFARSADITTQKILRLIEASSLSTTKGSFRDLAHMSEKLGFVQHADILIKIRLLRNAIAHEYNEENLNEVFKEVIKNSVHLIDFIKKIELYLEEKYP